MSVREEIFKTLDVYNNIANAYSDRWINDTSMNDQLLKFINHLVDGKKVLDVGSGTGRDVKYFKKQGVDALGIDISPEMVKISKKNVVDGQFIVMDMLEMNFDPETFNGIWACASVMHLPKLYFDQVLKNFNKLLTTNGILYLSVQRGEGSEYVEDGRYFEYFQPNEVIEYLKINGFQVIESLSNFSTKNTFNKPKTIEWINFYAKKIAYSLHEENEKNSCELCYDNGFYMYSQFLEDLPPNDIVLHETKNFFVIPDIAPLVTGHILIISKEHYLSFGQLPYNLFEEFKTVKEYIREKSIKKGVNLTFLEHGPTILNDAGACIDHAHFHCIPLNFDIINILNSEFSIFETSSMDIMRSYAQKNISYLYYDSPYSKNQYIIPLNKDSHILPRQYFRKKIAEQAKLKHWNWRKMIMDNDLNKSRILNTIENYNK